MSQFAPKSKWKSIIQELGQQLGFSFIGVSKADFLEEDAPKLEQWLNQGFHGKMKYMENHFDKRLDPRLLVAGSKSVISLLYNYYTDNKQRDESAPKFSIYSYGEDYHRVIKQKLANFVQQLTEQIGDFQYRIFVDSAPVLERTWAKKSGLGWIGKNMNLINKSQGSYFFLAELICDLELEPDGPIKDYCGTCTACIDACPTDAILPNAIDASKCISYLTIELKDEIIPNEFTGKFDSWVFGCDICQEVCPWNRFSKPHQEPAFLPKKEFLNFSKQDWLELTEEVFQELFRHSAVKRTKYKGLKRNINFIETE